MGTLNKIDYVKNIQAHDNVISDYIHGKENEVAQKHHNINEAIYELEDQQDEWNTADQNLAKTCN